MKSSCCSETKVNSRPTNLGLANKRTNLVLMLSLTILFMGPYRIPISLSHLIPYFLIFFLLVFSETKQLKIFDRRNSLFLISYFLSITFMLVFSIGIDISFQSMFANLDNLMRPLLLFIIGVVASKTWGLRGAILTTIFLSAMLALMQFISPDIAKDFLVSWYDEPRKVFHVLGSRRAIGTFALPADFGLFSLLGMIFCANEYVSASARQSGIVLLIALISSIICGVLSSSKTFYLGLGVVFVISVILRSKKRNVKGNILEQAFKRKMAVVFGFALALLVLAFLYHNNEDFRKSLNIFQNKMEDPVYAVIGGRYDYALVDLQNEIISSFPNGNGLQTGISASGSFIGDSGFLVTLFRGGLFGFLFYYFSILTICTKNRILLLVFFTAIMVELGRSAFMASRAADMLWLLVGRYYFGLEGS